MNARDTQKADGRLEIKRFEELRRSPDSVVRDPGPRVPGMGESAVSDTEADEMEEHLGASATSSRALSRKRTLAHQGVLFPQRSTERDLGVASGGK
jgi:hypothetical protein